MTVTEGLVIVLLSCIAVIVGELFLIYIWELIAVTHSARKARKKNDKSRIHGETTRRSRLDR